MKIIKTEYLGLYTIRCTFIDGVVKDADFSSFLTNTTQPMNYPFREKTKFKQFYLDDMGYCLSWGDNEMDIPSESIYLGDFDVVKKTVSSDGSKVHRIEIRLIDSVNKKIERLASLDGRSRKNYIENLLKSLPDA